MVGKLFPTSNPNHSQPLRTANFFTQQDIGGDYTDSIIALEHDSLVNPTQNPEEPKIPRSASRGLFRPLAAFSQTECHHILNAWLISEKTQANLSDC